MKKIYPLSFVVMFGMIGFAIVIVPGNVGLFIDIPSAILVFIPLITILLSFNSPSEIFRAFQLTGSSSQGTKRELKDALTLFESAQSLTYKIAILATLMGIIFMFSSNWKVDQFAKGFAVAILSVFYALLTVILIFIPCKGAIMKKIHALHE